MDETAIKGIHRRKDNRLAGLAHLVRHFANAAEKILLLFLPIAVDIDDHIGDAFLPAIENAVKQILQILEDLAVAPNQPARLRASEY